MVNPVRIEDLSDEAAIALFMLVPGAKFSEAYGQEAPEQCRVYLASGAWAVTMEMFEDFGDAIHSAAPKKREWLMDNGIGTIAGKDKVFVGRPVCPVSWGQTTVSASSSVSNALSVILPEMRESTKRLIAEFVRQVALPKEVLVVFEGTDPDIDGNPQTKLKARWRT